ncbi:hypothetical protein CCACVL1_21650 [Corchorus capsularis]|uniref:Uncharacterized protein n=1 Tax=Corchorus capsularis TaxID=210143 RepID=A0A1R3H2X1_COCAP|nr:hypothetical protein CCACVL1_21650 [Corchorus capsularis]
MPFELKSSWRHLAFPSVEKGVGKKVLDLDNDFEVDFQDVKDEESDFDDFDDVDDVLADIKPFSFSFISSNFAAIFL